MKYGKILIKCPFTKKPCFARTADQRCSILKEVDPAAKCNFQKERRLVTEGVTYPHEAAYQEYI